MHKRIFRPLNALGSPLISMMYLSAWMLILKAEWSSRFSAPLAYAGKMVLSNYLMQSVICLGFFFGQGFGWYGTFDRSEQFLTVIVIWAVQLLYSRIWIQHFSYGPLEWIWRALTHWKIPTISKS